MKATALGVSLGVVIATAFWFGGFTITMVTL